MSDTEKCPVCTAPVIHQVHEGGATTYTPAPLSPVVLTVALDNEAVARAVGALATPELRLALASVMLEGQPGAGDPFFSEQDFRDEAEAAARCEGVVLQMRKHGRELQERSDWADLAKRHRRRAMRILSLLPDAVQRKVQAEANGTSVH